MSEFRVSKLPKLKSASFPERLIFIDTETRPRKFGNIEIHKLRLAWVCTLRLRKDTKKPTEKWTEFHNAYALCKYIESEVKDKTTVYLFAHNIFFDLQVSQFFYHFSKWGWKLDFVYEKGLVYLLAMSKGKRHIKCISTTNYFYEGIDKLGERIGYPKLKVDFNNVTDEELSVYCKRDVFILKETLLHYIAFIKKHSLGGFCMTRASQAFTAFRSSYLKYNTYIDRVSYITELQRSAYYGGRVEAFRFGKVSGDKFVRLDINSQYPFVMGNYEVPVRLMDYKVRPKIDEVRDRLDKFLAVAEVRVSTQIPVYPKVINGRVCFPTGRFTTSVCTEGLKRGIENGWIKEVLQVSYYRGKKLFAEYVKDLYGLRVEYKSTKNSMMEQFCKYMLNSLYGKFGQLISVQEIEESEGTEYFREHHIDIDSGKSWIEYKLFNMLIRETGEKKEGKHSIVSIPAHITEYARFLLFDYMQVVGLKNVLYVDTDSITIEEKHLSKVEHLLSETELGKLKIEETSNTLEIYGAKNYKTDKYRKLKGVPKSAVEIAPGIYKYMEFTKQKTHMKKRIRKYYLVRERIKVVKPKYTKGQVLPSGLIVPFHLKEF